MLTNPRDALKVTKHSTIPHSFLLVCNSNFVFKMRRSSNIRLQKCRDFEIWVRGHSRSSKIPFYPAPMTSY